VTIDGIRAFADMTPSPGRILEMLIDEIATRNLPKKVGHCRVYQRNRQPSSLHFYKIQKADMGRLANIRQCAHIRQICTGVTEFGTRYPLKQTDYADNKPIRNQNAGIRIEYSCSMNGSNFVEIFKKCSLCGKEWYSAKEFLDDAALQLNGYQGHLRLNLMGLPARGLLVFTHTIKECGTTIAVPARHFKKNEEQT
jgi:hypothetical protein